MNKELTVGQKVKHPKSGIHTVIEVHHTYHRDIYYTVLSSEGHEFALFPDQIERGLVVVLEASGAKQ